MSYHLSRAQRWLEENYFPDSNAPLTPAGAVLAFAESLDEADSDVYVAIKEFLNPPQPSQECRLMSCHPLITSHTVECSKATPPQPVAVEPVEELGPFVEKASIQVMWCKLNELVRRFNERIANERPQEKRPVERRPDIF